MADDLDQLIRAAMKTLDEEVPSGYFEALPNQTLARLEGSMQHGSSGTTDSRDTGAVPPPMTDAVDDAAPAPNVKPIMEQDREEDSGLHDIRNLAQSTKQRLSSRKITTPPIADDVLAGASGSFANIALPQPAKMVSLPDIGDLPSSADVAAAERAAKEAKEAAKRAAKEAKDAQKTAKEAQKAKPAEVAAVAAPAVEVPAPAPVAPARQAFKLPSQQSKSSKGPILAIVGLGLAAAAGGFFYLNMTKKDEAKNAAVAEAPRDQAAAMAPTAGAGSAVAAAPTVTAEPIETQPAPEAAKAEEVAPPPPVEQQIAADNAEDKDTKAKKSKPSKGGKSKVEEKEETPKVEAPKPPEKTDPKKAQPTAKAEGGDGEPSVDALLKEAGVTEKKENKPKLAKKSLTGDDFKKAMGAVSGKAKACYNGTQGTALVKLTVAPSGQISKISVAGDFAGKSEGACVESAIKGATFPPWDGGPQSFSYAVLLSD